MAPNMASGDMKFVGPYGQPMNVIKFEMPGPDGKMMQFLQIPSMPQGAIQPVMMAQPVTGMVYLFCSILFLLLRKSGSCAVFWTNPYPLRS